MRQAGAWVRFTRAWAWDIPKWHGRATKHFRAETEIRLTREQLQSALAAGVVELISNPRLAARQTEADDAG